MPAISALLTGFASKLTDLENYETIEGMKTPEDRSSVVIHTNIYLSS